MAEKEKIEASKVLEADFVKRASSGNLYVDGVIVFSYRDDKFDYLPGEGYPDCPTFGEMTETEIDRDVVPMKERDATFILKTPQDPVGTEAKVFLRVEQGNIDISVVLSSSKSLTLHRTAFIAGTEIQKTAGILFYLNEKLGSETGFEEKRRRYSQMLWSHRDILLKDYLYQIRSNAQPIWIWESQTSFGAAIKYRKVSDCP